jgi:YXWGXW repeat-containing protein
MTKHKLLLAALVASSMSIGMVPTTASADFGVFVDVAPPAPRHEVVPAPRRGYVWAPGYWDWRKGRYAWVRGHWEREHRGQFWHPNRWEQRDGRWVLQRGGWNKSRWEGDRDHDGIPNRLDRDKDNDGVPNRVDRAPNNPNRR